MRNWIAVTFAGALLGVLVAGGPRVVEPALAAGPVNTELRLQKTSLKLVETLGGLAHPERDKVKMTFDIPESFGDLQAGDRIAINVRAIAADGFTVRTVSLGDYIALDLQVAQAIVLEEGRKGRLQTARDARIPRFDKVKATYIPIQPGRRPGRFTVALARGKFAGTFGSLPFFADVHAEGGRRAKLKPASVEVSLRYERSGQICTATSLRDDLSFASRLRPKRKAGEGAGLVKGTLKRRNTRGR